MALKIRLRQQGRRNRLVYRLVLSDSRSPRDGKYIETLGWYNPHEAEPEKNVKVESERVLHWLSQGAVLTEKAEKLVRRASPDVAASIHQKKLAKKTKATTPKKKSKKEVAGSAK